MACVELEFCHINQPEERMTPSGKNLRTRRVDRLEIGTVSSYIVYFLSAILLTGTMKPTQPLECGLALWIPAWELG